MNDQQVDPSLVLNDLIVSLNRRKEMNGKPPALILPTNSGEAEPFLGNSSGWKKANTVRLNSKKIKVVCSC